MSAITRDKLGTLPLEDIPFEQTEKPTQYFDLDARFVPTHDMVVVRLPPAESVDAGRFLFLTREELAQLLVMFPQEDN